MKNGVKIFKRILNLSEKLGKSPPPLEVFCWINSMQDTQYGGPHKKNPVFIKILTDNWTNFYKIFLACCVNDGQNKSVFADLQNIIQ